MRSDKVNKYISYLEGLGYKIIKPLKTGSEKITNTNLILLFYDKLEYKFGREFRLFLKDNSSKDRKALTKLHTKAKKTGLTAGEVNSAVAFSIEMLFKHYDSIGILKCPDSFEFIISHGGWMLSKALEVEERIREEYYDSDEFVYEVDKLCEVPSDLFKIKKEERQTSLKR